MRAELFMYFCIKNYIGAQGEVCRQLKYFKPPVVYATDRSEAVVLMLVLIFMWLCGFYFWPFYVECCLVLCSRVFSFV